MQHTDYGLRLLRGNSGANAESNIAHKGTGALSLITEEAAPIVLATSNATPNACASRTPPHRLQRQRGDWDEQPHHAARCKR
jgi:hypothetical protein